MSQQEIKVTCETKLYLPLSELNEFQGELKTLSDVNYKKLKKQILDQGFCAPVFVWRDKSKFYLLDGHQRKHTLEKMQYDGFKVPSIPVVEVFAKTKLEAKKKLLSYVSQFGKVSAKGLFEFMLEADIELESMDEFEIPELDMDAFKEEFFPDEPPPGDGNEDDIPEVAQNELGVELGDIYQLGEHRIMCGDSTDFATIQKLMDGKKADMLFTDPPYGVDYHGSHKGLYRSGDNSDVSKSRIKNDKVSDIHNIYYKFLSNVIRVFEGPAYMFCGAGKEREVLNSIKECNLEIISTLVWRKDNGSTALNANYKPVFELFYYFKNGKDRKWSGDHCQWTCWDIKKNSKNEFHPTQKPVELIKKALLNHSASLVVDPFLGSGSTLIACEDTARKCYGMELDPHYCSVIIKRWEHYSGKKHKKILEGK